MMLFSSWLEEGGELESYCLESAIGSLLCTIFVLIVVDCNMKLYQVPALGTTEHISFLSNSSSEPGIGFTVTLVSAGIIPSL